jgi:hypothetical protein
MGYTRRISIALFALFLFLSAAAVSSSAQTRLSRRVVYRPYVVRHYGWYDPFWSRSSWWGYDPYWSDPYLMEMRERYYKEQAVRDARKKLAKDRAKFREDGVLTAKEREKLDKHNRDYYKAVQKLNKFYREG